MSLKINRGTTYTITVNYQKDGAPATLVGATVRFTVKTSEFSAVTDDTDAVIKKDITTGNSSGVATITLNPSDTATLPPGSYFYDIKVKEADGTVYKINEGKINLDASPTNRLT